MEYVWIFLIAVAASIVWSAVRYWVFDKSPDWGWGGGRPRSRRDK